nr:ornithine cyclodeaminase family protein [uncultured Rhizobium sp.]
MSFLNHRAVEGALDWERLINALSDAFAAGRVVSPARQTLTIELPNGEQGYLLLMPAWEPGNSLGVKVVTFFPGNAQRGDATINAGYLLFDGGNGKFRMAADGDALTVRRTAAASALAARFLARPDARRLLVVGTGQLAVNVAQAHAVVRDYAKICIWGRNADKSRQLANDLVDMGLKACATEDLEDACRAADVISCVTASTAPLIHGEWLGEGSHLDLVGAFKADMRESDNLCVTQATVFVDGREGALLSGDLAQPIADGILRQEDILADLRELVTGAHSGRTHQGERTLFKSVGMALEDLVAAGLAATAEVL